MTSDEIRMQKILDELCLDRLIEDRDVYDMDGWGEEIVGTFYGRDSLLTRPYKETTE